MTSISGLLPALAAPVACGCCLVVGAAYVAVDDPSDGGVFLPCPFRSLTGWWCPGCGLTRATHHLFRGDVTQALRYNLLVVLVLAGVGTAWLAWTLQAAGRSLTRGRALPTWAPVAAVVVLLVFAIARNATDLPLTG